MKFQTQRSISFLSVHTCFLATLCRFQLRESSLYNRTKDGRYFRNGVEVAEDGLDYPTFSRSQPCLQTILRYITRSALIRRYRLKLTGL